MKKFPFGPLDNGTFCWRVNMNLKKGEVYICTEPYCKAEIEVRRGAEATCHGKYVVRCCCGKEMVREDQLEFARPRRMAAQAR
jgi:hypothetical protein